MITTENFETWTWTLCVDMWLCHDKTCVLKVIIRLFELESKENSAFSVTTKRLSGLEVAVCQDLNSVLNLRVIDGCRSCMQSNTVWSLQHVVNQNERERLKWQNERLYQTPEVWCISLNEQRHKSQSSSLISTGCLIIVVIFQTKWTCFE